MYYEIIVYQHDKYFLGLDKKIVTTDHCEMIVTELLLLFIPENGFKIDVNLVYTKRDSIDVKDLIK